MATPTPEPAAMSSPTATSTPTATPTPTTTPESGGSATTPTPAGTSTPAGTPTWTKPSQPNSPEAKYDETNRTYIYDAALVNREQSASGNGVVAFDVEVVANTTMRDVDPPDHGTVAGEPYFLVYANDELIYRSEQVEFRNGTFTLDIHPASLRQFEAGPLKVTVFLMDRDSTYDDEYAYASMRIRYSPESASENGTETTSG